MNYSEPDIDQLISLYLSGRASALQRQELERWLLASAKNRATFHRLEKIWTMSFPSEYDSPMDKVRDKIWANTVEDVSLKEITKKNFKPTRSWLKVAAVFILFLIGGWLFSILNSTEQPVVTTEVVWLEKINPKGQRSSHLLPDGTKVWLNVASQLSFPEEFSDTLRPVRLVGEAFFEVAKNPEKPFVVETEGLTTLVLGTTFNVNAYPESAEIKVALLEGKVQVQNKSPSEVQTSILEPGEELLAPKDYSTFIKQPFQYENTFGWKEGILIFDGIDFESFRKTIENWYGIDVELKGTAPRNWSVRARYQRAPLQHVLQDISFNKNMNFEIKDKIVVITF